MEIARESIFVSAIRTFCRMFFGIIGILIGIFLFSLFYSSFSPSPLTQQNTELSLLPDAQGKRELVPLSAPAILQISVHGVIGDPQHLNAEVFENILLDSQEGLLARHRVKGILLHFNTPGGTVVDSNAIYEMLLTYKKRYQVPIFGYVEGLCASGGMYIASATDRLFAGPASTIGSVGVIIGPFFNISDLMGKVGLQAKTLTQGIDKDMMNPTRPWVEGEDRSLKNITSFMYEHFVDVVTQARPKLSRDKLVSQYGAQVFDCVTAEKYGYIDEPMSSRDQALIALLQQAKIDPASPYQVVALTPKKSWMSEFVQGKSPLFSGTLEHKFDVGQLPIEPQQVAYLYQP